MDELFSGAGCWRVYLKSDNDVPKEQRYENQNLMKDLKYLSVLNLKMNFLTIMNCKFGTKISSIHTGISFTHELKGNTFQSW